MRTIISYDFATQKAWNEDGVDIDLNFGTSNDPEQLDEAGSFVLVNGLIHHAYDFSLDYCVLSFWVHPKTQTLINKSLHLSQ